MKQKNTSSSQIVNNEDGSILLLALFMLFAVTMLGFFSTNTSTIETQATANNAYYKKAFYAAEAGLEHGQTLITPLMRFNEQNGESDWSTALEGPDAVLPDDDAGLVDGRPDPDNGAVWLQDQQLGDCTYTVAVYDDWEGDEGSQTNPAIEDSNGRIYMRAEAIGPRGARAMVETILTGVGEEQTVTDYTAQTGAGASKSFEGGDKGAIEGTDATTVAATVGT